MKINVMGLGKLGFPMAMFLTNSNYKIQCHDINKNLTKNLKENVRNYLPHESGLKKYLKKIKYIKIFEDSIDSLKECNISFITVPTPSLKNGKFSNKNIINVLKTIAEYIKNYRNKKSPFIININSTVSPGSFDNEFNPFMEKMGLINNVDYIFIYNPYFVALGDVLSTLENPDFILVGRNNKEAVRSLNNIYKKIYAKPNLKEMSLKEAELTKLLINCYLTSKISFTNFVKEIGEKFKINSVTNILDAIGSDKRIGKNYLKSGGPFSGPCFPRDNKALKSFCNELQIKPLLPITTQNINLNTFHKYCKIIDVIKKKKIKNIGFLGIAYKAKTDFLDHSVTMKLIKKSQKLKLNIFYYDKYVAKNRINCTRCRTIEDLVKRTDVVYISYYDKEFKKLEKIKPKNKKIYIWDNFDLISSKKVNKFTNLSSFLDMKKINSF
jgi:UDPglucose 6-dehydrogenase